MRLNALNRPSILTTATLILTGTLHAQSWTQVPTATLPPVGGSNSHAMVFDLNRGAAVLRATNTYEFSGTDWQLVSTPTNPTPTVGSAMAYDSSRGVTVLHAGSPGPFGPVLNETWEYDGIDWTMVSTNGPSRIEATMAFDASTGKMVLHGGSNLSGGLFTDTWEYDGATATWTQVATAVGPTTFNQMALEFDPQINQIVMFGGQTTTFGHSALTWLYDGALQTWTLASPTNSPSGRRGVRGAYDFARGGVLIHGGTGGATTMSDTWIYDAVANTWNQVATGGPTLDTALLAYDPFRSSVVMFGGFDGVTFSTTNDTWELGGGASWTTYGLGCGGITLDSVAGDRPVIGQMFDLAVSGLPISPTTGLLMLYTDRLQPGLDLNPFGASPGCEFQVGGAFIGQLPISASSSTAAVSINLTVPGATGLVGLQLSAQAAMFGIPGLALTLGMSNGGTMLFDNQ